MNEQKSSLHYAPSRPRKRHVVQKKKESIYAYPRGYDTSTHPRAAPAFKRPCSDRLSNNHHRTASAPARSALAAACSARPVALLSSRRSRRLHPRPPSPTSTTSLSPYPRPPRRHRRPVPPPFLSFPRPPRPYPRRVGASAWFCCRRRWRRRRFYLGSSALLVLPPPWCVSSARG